MPGMVGSGGLRSPLWSKFTVLRPSPLDVANGLIGWWPLTSIAADDISGGGNVGKKVGAPSIAAGILGYAATFGGSADCFNGSNYANITNFTCCGWAYKTAAGSNIPIMAQMNNTGTLVTFQFGIGAGFAQCLITVGGTSKVIACINWDTSFLNQWHHAALSYDGANLRFYSDGALQATAATTGTPDVPAAGNFAIARAGANGAFGYTGRLNDMRLYNRALSAGEINMIYHSGLAYGSLYSEGDMPSMRSPALLNPFYNFDWPVPYGPLEV